MNKHVRQAFGLTICKNSHPEIRKLRRRVGEAEIHGNKFWKSTFLLMDYLREYPIEKGSKVLEIGCGWGLGGIFCAKEFGAQVTSLDADSSVFPFLEFHAELNDIEITTWHNRYEKIRVVDFQAFDLVIGADICFWDSMSDLLFNLARRAHRSGTARVVMTDPGRPPFRSMAERAMHSLDANYTDWFVHHPFNASGLVLDIEPR